MPQIPYQYHVFVCTNERPAGSPRGCCASKGAFALHAKLKELTKGSVSTASIRINKSGCLDQCEAGITMVVYPEAVWYSAVTEADLVEIVESHFKAGKPVERLFLRKGSTS